MDESPEYVQMCRQAKEIQEQWKWQEGDFYAAGEHTCKEFTHPKIITGVCSEPYPPENKCGFCKRPFYAEIWALPRQDQLMQLTKKQGRGIALLLSLCLEIDYSPKQDYFIAFETIEQVLLAHVMYFNYKKTYNGSEWVAE